MKKQRCLIAMSGGVDSSVAAALMQQNGYECAGITMRLYNPTCPATSNIQSATECSSKPGKAQEKGQVCLSSFPNDTSAVEDAARVCNKLGIPHFALDLTAEFEAQVIEPFVEGYSRGYTPNPCVECNRYLKFSALLAWALEEGFDCLATGHYAQIVDGRLCKAKDSSKDQSYVLYNLTAEQLGHLCFPLGQLSKKQVRLLAGELELSTANKPESQDICFIPQGEYADFIEAYLLKRGRAIPQSGNFIDTSGTVLGVHKGIHHYTIGQRRGLGISAAEPLYVLSIDALQDIVQVGTDAERGRNTAYINRVNVLNPQSLAEEKTLRVKHRYRGREHNARVFMQDDNTSRIVFSEKQSDLTKGQALVIYDGDCVVGGGTIQAVE